MSIETFWFQTQKLSINNIFNQLTTLYNKWRVFISFFFIGVELKLSFGSQN